MKPILGHISKNQIKFIRSLQLKKVRDEEGLFVAEGNKCIKELVNHFELVTLVVTNDCQQEYQASLLASRSELAQMSSLKTPQGSLAVFRQKSFSPKDGLSAESGLILALDNIQDPGNLGTIIRTADWFGITDIYCSKETADCYNSKVVQATMGALARVNIHYVNLVEWLQATGNRQQGFSTPIYGTLLDGRNIYENGAIEDVSRGIIIMGNEGNGISAEVKRFITHPLYIPNYKEETVESLNVAIATAITLAEFRRLDHSQLK